jgi:DNA-binding MarR family transcriptional regulator
MGLDEATRWLTPEEMRAWRALLGAQHRLGRVLDLELQAAHGTTLGDHEVLIILSEQTDGALRMADLADMLTISRSGLTRRVDRMAAAGLVSRERCASDGRGVLARITAAGWQALERATPVHVAGVRHHFVEALDPSDLLLLADALEKVATEAPGPGLVSSARLDPAVEAAAAPG